ncbi:MAG: hypothetical protein SGBAC_009460 [Bacillariaceae sp.]
MATLASRIQERASQFISEQEKLLSLQAELQLATCVEQEETERTQKYRGSLLEVSHDRFGIERNICDVNDEIDDYKRFNTSLQTDIQRLEESAGIVCEKIEDDIKQTFSPHDANVALYFQALESTIIRRKRRLSEAHEGDENFRAGIAFLQIEEEQLSRETLHLVTEINQLEEEEIRSDRTITSLARKVQDSLSKRISLRQSLAKCRKNTSSSDEDV